MDAYLTLDIGGTNIRAAIFTKQDFEPVAQRKINTVSENQTPIERILWVVREIWPNHLTVKGICAAVPGSVNVNEGVILLAPNISGWKDVEFAHILHNEFRVPVFVNNDARLAAIGEWKRGAGRGHENLLYFTISTGLGGGAIVHNRILEGDLGIATESGHVVVDENGPLCGCGKRGHLEAFCAGTGIENFVKDQLSAGVKSTLNPTDEIRASDIANAARKGDALSISAFERSGYYLGVGIANYLHIFNPSCVIFGGGVTHSSDLWMPKFKQSLEEHVLNRLYLQHLEIKMAELGDNAGLAGAFEYMAEQLSVDS
jgi:glucokinase